MLLPNEGAGFWPLISMGAILGGTMRSPLTGVVFALELTHDVHVMLPLLIASVIAHAFTVLVLRRSILTEKVARRGYHLSREYAVDPLEILLVREVMRTNIVALPVNASLHEVSQQLYGTRHGRDQRLYPLVNGGGQLVGVVTRTAIQEALQAAAGDFQGRTLADVGRTQPVVAYPDESLRVIVYRMAGTGLTRMPVILRSDPRQLVGIITLTDLLKARTHILVAEQRRERVLPLRLVLPRARRGLRFGR
jgi:CBS domain-containing protein